MDIHLKKISKWALYTEQSYPLEVPCYIFSLKIDPPANMFIDSASSLPHQQNRDKE